MWVNTGECGSELARKLIWTFCMPMPRSWFARCSLALRCRDRWRAFMGQRLRTMEGCICESLCRVLAGGNMARGCWY